MPIAVLVAAVASYAYALLTRPRFRAWGIGLGLLAGIALALFLRSGGPDRPAIPPETLVIDLLDLTRTPRGADLTGRVQNTSTDFRLLDMTLRLRLHDCPAPGMTPSDCPVIGEATAIARPDVPPGQIRGLSASFVFANLPPLLGTLSWDWDVVDTRAGP